MGIVIPIILVTLIHKHLYVESLRIQQITEERKMEELVSNVILDISQRFLKKDLPVAVLTPNMWAKYQKNLYNHDVMLNMFGDVLLERIHNSHHRSVLTYGVIPNLGNVLEFNDDYISPPDKQGSVVLLLNNGALDTQVKLLYSMLYRLQTDSWNPRARYIIVSLTRSSPDEQENAVYYVAKMMKRYLISDFVFLVPEYLEDVAMPYFHAFTWLPSDERICVDIGIVRQLDVWVPSENTFHFNNDLFPSKDIKNFKKCPMKYCVEIRPPYVIHFEKARLIHGSEMFLFEIVKEATDSKSVIYFNTGNNSISDFLKREADILGPIEIMPAAFHYFDVSYPHFMDSWTWAVPSPRPVPKWQSLIRIFNLLMWVLIMLSLILGSLTFWLYQRYGRRTATNSTVNNIDVSLILLRTLLTLLGVGIPDKFERHFKLFFAIWLFFCFHIYAVYQSMLISFLAYPGKIPALKTVDEIIESGIAICGEEHMEKIEHFESNRKCFERIGRDYDIAIQASRISLQFYSTAMRDDFQFNIIDEANATQLLGLYFQKGSPYYKIYEETTKRLQSAGIIDFWLTHEIKIIQVLNKKEHLSEYIAFSISHLQGAFFMLLFGHILAVISFISEIYISRMLKFRYK